MFKTKQWQSQRNLSKFKKGNCSCCFPQLRDPILQLFILTSQFCTFFFKSNSLELFRFGSNLCGELRQVAKRSSIMLIVHRTRRLDNVDPISPGAVCSPNYNVPTSYIKQWLIETMLFKLIIPTAEHEASGSAGNVEVLDDIYMKYSCLKCCMASSEVVMLCVGWSLCLLTFIYLVLSS